MSERRTSQRITGELEVLLTLGSGGISVKGKTKNVSDGGLFVLTKDSLDQGMRVGLILRHPETGQTMAVDGKIVHVLNNVGVGVEFQALSERSQEQLRGIIEKFRETTGMK